MKTIATSDTRLDRDARELYDALQDLLRVYQFRDRDRICCHDLSLTQCYALDVLRRRRAVSVNDLAADLYLDKSTTSRVVQALERKRFTQRRRDPDDKRVVEIQLTRAGRDVHERIREGIIEQERELLSDFDSDTRRAMTTLVRRLAQAAGACVDTSRGSCCAIQ